MTKPTDLVLAGGGGPVVAGAAAVAISALSFHLVERPVLARRGRIEDWLARRRPAA